MFIQCLYLYSTRFKASFGTVSLFTQYNCGRGIYICILYGLGPVCVQVSIFIQYNVQGQCVYMYLYLYSIRFRAISCSCYILIFPFPKKKYYYSKKKVNLHYSAVSLVSFPIDNSLQINAEPFFLSNKTLNNTIRSVCIIFVFLNVTGWCLLNFKNCVLKLHSMLTLHILPQG